VGKYGKHVIAVVEAAEVAGDWTPAMELVRRAGLDVAPNYSTKLCMRSVSYGMMEVNETSYPARFKAVPGWRAIVEAGQKKPRKSRAKAKEVPKRPLSFARVPDRIPRVPNSVFALGAMYG